jgi:hypothetical protein
MRSVKIRRGVRQGCCLLLILFNLYSEYVTKESLEGFGDFKIGGQVIRTVKYADDLVLLAKEEMVLQGVVDKTNCIWKTVWNGHERGKTKAMRI